MKNYENKMSSGIAACRSEIPISEPILYYKLGSILPFFHKNKNGQLKPLSIDHAKTLNRTTSQPILPTIFDHYALKNG